METREIIGRKVHICCSGCGGPLILVGTGTDGAAFADTLFGRVNGALGAVSDVSSVRDHFTLAVYGSEDWDRDYSPWKAIGAVSGQTFSGGGEQTLRWLEAAAEQFSAEFSADAIYPAGYSLAGLFSLWALYASDRFSGCACCSGTLWRSDWDGFARQRKLSREAAVYMSLGGKEERTKNPVMATVGEKTRAQVKLLEKDPSVRKLKFEMNPGGHFSDPDGRLSKGIVWLIQNS